MTKHTVFTKSMVVAVALTTTFALSGCFANPIDQLTDKIGSEIAEGGAEKLVEGITGGELDLETGGELPKDFPAEVPVVDGTVQTAIASTIEGTKTWIVTFAVDDADAAMASVRDEFMAAGYEEVLWSESEVMTNGSLTNDNYIVIVSNMMSSEDEQVISYSVSENTSTE